MGDLLEKINRREATVVVVGLGYVGLPLACALATAGFRVLGVDLVREKVEGINAGRSHIEDVPSDVVRGLVAAGRLEATNGYAKAQKADVAIIAVPTPVDEQKVPDLSFLKSAALGLAEVMHKGTLVIVESTTYPDATEEIVVAEFAAHGFQPGSDVSIGFSPERIDPRNEKWNVTNTPKLVSGLTESCLELTLALYSNVVATLVPVSNIRTAEMAKLFENVFRNVNIALVNELRVICDKFDVDVWEVIAACATKPYGFMPFYPGPGVGGHCIPVDPYYLSWKADQRNISTEFIDLAARINDAVPGYIVQKAAEVLGRDGKKLSGARVGLLGVAYKRNTSDVRETPATHIVEILLKQGAAVAYFDPHVPAFHVGNHQLASAPTLAGLLESQDCIIVATDHDAIDWSLVLQYAPIVVDTRNAIGRLKARGVRQRVGRTGD